MINDFTLVRPHSPKEREKAKKYLKFSVESETSYPIF